MAVVSAAVTVAATATQLAAPTAPTTTFGGTRNKIGASVQVPSGGSTVYVGGPDVTTANGYAVAAGTAVSIDLAPGDVLYGIVASSTQAVRVLTVEV